MKTRSFIFTFFLLSQCVFSQQNDKTYNVFKFHPNPAEEHIFILGTHKIKHIEILDISGKPVVKHQLEKSIIKLDVSNLKSGVYLLHVTDENDKQDVKKLLIK